jgi:hypothetical protein
MQKIRNFAEQHPRISSWIVLAIGMTAILIWSAKDVGFTGGQWAAVIVTTILLAGACVWIIGWGDDEEEPEEESKSPEKPGSEPAGESK